MRSSRVFILSLSLAAFTWTCEKAERLRPIEPRLVGGFSHAPCRTDAGALDLVPDAVCDGLSLKTAGGAQPPPVELPSVRGTMRRTGSLGDLREQGVRRILSSDGIASLDRGVKELESAAAAEPGNARAWSDLAAAYLFRAQRLDDPRDVLWALAAAQRALREDNSLAEAHFNLALALDHLFLTSAARDAWEAYQDVEQDPAWHAEAEERMAGLARRTAPKVSADHLARLERAALAGDAGQVQAIVWQFRQAAREHAEQTLLGEWADALAKGEAGRAARRLGIARAIGQALVRVNGDRLVHDAVATIDQASSQADPGDLRALIEGHREFRQGYALYKARTIRPAAARLEAARRALARAGSPFAARAAFYLSCCDYFEGRCGPAFQDFEGLARDLAGRSYDGLLGHALWMQALCGAVEGRMAQAVEIYQQSLVVYRKTGEMENVASLEALLAEALRFLGHGGEAWEHAYQALRQASQVRDPGIRSMIYMIAADAALADGAAAAALALQREVVLQAAPASPVRQVEALTWLGWMEAHAGSRDRALRALREAGEKVRTLDEPLRRRREADLATVKGILILREEPRRAISLLSSALAVYQEDENHAFALRALRARAQAERLAGDDARAEEDLRAGLAAYERLGANLQREEVRLAHLEEMGAAFDEMISLQADRDPALAFAYADRARTRVLPGSASKLWTPDRAEGSRLLAAEPRPLSLDEIRRRLPADVSLVQFSVLADRVLIWRLRRDGGPELFARPVRREELEARVERLRRFSQRGKEAWETASGELFDLLVRPWLAQTDKEERLVFVPDKVLHLVPFAALRDRSTGHFLIQGHTIVVAPSATLYINALERQEEDWGSLSRGLVVGDPAIDRSRFQDLLPLPGAAAEAARLATLTGAVLLVGPVADKPSFLREAAQAEWIHLASHAAVEPRNPLLSHLVLAPDGRGDAGELTAREIYALDLAGTRLVVLAACDTGREYVPGSEGVTSLARAFHAAGVPTVVASLWKVADETTARFFDVFHHNLRAGADPASALREAQLVLLASPDEAYRSPAAWGVFEVIGASAH